MTKFKIGDRVRSFYPQVGTVIELTKKGFILKMDVPFSIPRMGIYSDISEILEAGVEHWEIVDENIPPKEIRFSYFQQLY